MAAQKTLIQQLQESEAEARELQEFMQVSTVAPFCEQLRIWLLKEFRILAEVYSEQANQQEIKLNCNSLFYLVLSFILLLTFHRLPLLY